MCADMELKKKKTNRTPANMCLAFTSDFEAILYVGKIYQPIHQTPHTLKCYTLAKLPSPPPLSRALRDLIYIYSLAHNL